MLDSLRGIRSPVRLNSNTEQPKPDLVGSSSIQLKSHKRSIRHRWANIWACHFVSMKRRFLWKRIAHYFYGGQRNWQHCLWICLTAAMYNTRGCSNRVIMKVCTRPLRHIVLSPHPSDWNCFSVKLSTNPRKRVVVRVSTRNTGETPAASMPDVAICSLCVAAIVHSYVQRYVIAFVAVRG